MVLISYFFIIFIAVFDLPSVWSFPYTGYCSLPCPFMCPAPSPWQYGGRPNVFARGAFSEYEDNDPNSTIIKTRQSIPEDQPEPAPKPKPKPKPDENDAEPKKKSSNPSPPTRRFFTSLFSIPGAVVDTVLSGEIVL